MINLSLVLPVYNEEDIIIPVVADIEKNLNKLKITYEILLVENESTDNTLSVITTMAKKNKHLVIVQAANGYGSAIIAGIHKARGVYVGYMPSDGQIDTEVLPLLWKEISTNAVDVAKIYRQNRESWIRFVRSKIFNYLTRLLYPINVRDINGSPRIVKRTLLNKINLFHPDSFIDTEFTIKAYHLKLTTSELPMKNLDRLGGKSTVNIKTVIEFLRNLYQFRYDNRFIDWKNRLPL